MELKEYTGHIRNWKNLCKELNIDTNLSREEREKEIIINAYKKWGYLIGIFGNLNDNTNRGCIFLIVLVISFLICGGSYYVASLCAKKRAKADK